MVTVGLAEEKDFNALLRYDDHGPRIDVDIKIKRDVPRFCAWGFGSSSLHAAAATASTCW
jgi:hypothetical protein